MGAGMNLSHLLNPEAEKALVDAGFTKEQAAKAVKLATPFIVAHTLGQAAAHFDLCALVQNAAEMTEKAKASTFAGQQLRTMF